MVVGLKINGNVTAKCLGNMCTLNCTYQHNRVLLELKLHIATEIPMKILQLNYHDISVLYVLPLNREADDAIVINNYLFTIY